MTFSKGPIIFFSTSLAFACYRSSCSDQNNSEGSDEDMNIKTSGMKRTDSEYSLGLNKSESVEKNLNELGSLCQSGQIIVLFGKSRMMILAGVAVISRMRSRL